ncbi:hypothetical protein KAR91_51620, partial [Candidatus Pacearchaeota archaeon]|nr:hypothetical protein [Candidatus Pacearchaeota archaeon]
YSFQLDNDLDSISDELDFDDDNDGYLDEWELLLETDPMDSTSQPIDTDGDDSPNGDEHNSQVWMDYDDDNDGFNDTLELEIGTNPLDNNSIPLDYDNDGIIDYFDNDDDNDGYNDTIDQFPLDPTEWFDTDGDGIGDGDEVYGTGDGNPRRWSSDPTLEDSNFDGVNDLESIRWNRDPMGPPVEVPVTSPLGLAALAGGIGLAGVGVLRRRKK